MTTRRAFLQLLGLTGLTSGLVGCDAALERIARQLDGVGPDAFRPPSGAEIDLVTHILNRLTFGPRPEDYARVAAMGADAFIEEQLNHEAIPDTGAQWRREAIPTVNEWGGELYNHHPLQLLEDMTRAKVLSAVYSRRQLYEVMVDFWTDHFNIASSKGDCRWIKLADDREVVRQHALGNFRAMLRASAVSPAMLIYLDGHDNKVRHPDERPNENYARELMELHTLGVHGGYTQADVMEVARCLSGWTYRNEFWTPYRVKFDPKRHDDGAKTVLGQTIPAGGGEGDLDRVLDIVCAHPSTARYLATKLCRKFIANDPPAEAVIQVAEAFTVSQYDIRATLRALFATEAFRAARGNLFKRPGRFVISAMRATGAETNVDRPIIEALERMGHAPFQYPTPDGYPMEPEPWLGSLLWRWNFAIGLVEGRLNGTRVDAETLVKNFGDRNRLAAHLLGRTPTEEEAAVVQGDAALALLLASPAFQYH